MELAKYPIQYPTMKMYKTIPEVSSKLLTNDQKRTIYKKAIKPMNGISDLMYIARKVKGVQDEDLPIAPC